MRIYIAGPMTGHDDFNRAAFNAEAARLEDTGHVAVNPIDTDPRHAGPCRTGGPIAKSDRAGHRHPYGCWMKASLARLVTCRGIVLLPGWETSDGARLELSIAEATGMIIEYREDH